MGEWVDQSGGGGPRVMVLELLPVTILTVQLCGKIGFHAI